jgi:hypothetical protein
VFDRKSIHQSMPVQVVVSPAIRKKCLCSQVISQIELCDARSCINAATGSFRFS